MFQDERINNRVSQIYAKAILYTILITLLYVTIKSIVFGFDIRQALPDLIIIIVGSIIVCIDIFKSNAQLKDERIQFERLKYYETSSKVFLGLSLLGFAVVIPLQYASVSYYPPSELLFMHLLLLGFIFFAYQLKKHKIFFNYSFIEKETGYYLQVFKNILKLLILTALIYSVALIISFIMYFNHTWLFLVLFNVLLGFIVTILTLSLVYLFISWIERLNFESLAQGRQYLTAQILVGSTYLVLSAMMAFLKYYLSNFDPTSMMNVDEYLASIVTISSYISHINRLLFVILFTNILIQFKEKVPGIGVMIITVMIATATHFLVQPIQFLSFIQTPQNSELYGLTLTYMGLGVSLVQLIGLFLLTAFLVKKGLSRARLIFPMMHLVFIVMNLGYSSYPPIMQAIIVSVEFIFSILYISSLMLIPNEKEVLID